MAEITTEASRHSSQDNLDDDNIGQDPTVAEEMSENSQDQTQLLVPDKKTESSLGTISDSTFNSQRVFKKSSSNNKLTLYLASRDLVVSAGKIDRLQGVLLVDPDYLQDKKVYGQVTLTFRYGREDEEVMGLKFCNEAVMCLAQLYPPYPGAEHQETNTPLQETLIKRLGANAHAFTMEITPLAPPSVQLVPAKEYNGAPIGTSYDVRAYVAEKADEKLHRRTMVRMGIRVVQRSSPPPLPLKTPHSIPTATGPSLSAFLKPQRTKPAELANDIIEQDELTPPHAAVEKPFLLSDGRVGLEARLDRAIYSHGDSIFVHVNVNNNSSKSVRRIKVFVVQHVDVCMFSNGKFKNVVALVSSQDGCPVGPGSSLTTSYSLKPIKGSTKNWIALEDSYTKAGATLASTVVSSGNSPEDRNVFAIYVSYYVKVKLLVSGMGGEVSLKLPFSLMHNDADPDFLTGLPSPLREPSKPLDSSKTRDANFLESETKQQLPKSESSREECDKGQETRSTNVSPKRKENMEDVDLIERCDEDGGT
ncbi:arrestin homolog [Neodiprion virginianus]|uniref:arrestin homolog n=1 Tax=Neodiprion virginianus TaxID=2961670 RepID=UPI001EE73BDE|nr:arrestin homolog [Neodiprion virginianus]XP_046615320.1 arrestin homolog [Neodiprion virginianus]XP_046615321.1 arrestin homolog [Neodiprion virginianus]XP_046615322.1 arrestin homolog [Neodiprion virginianus]XP_046615323.1 arrestin homolog [Neodiprion virginianus]